MSETKHLYTSSSTYRLLGVLPGIQNAKKPTRVHRYRRSSNWWQNRQKASLIWDRAIVISMQKAKTNKIIGRIFSGSKVVSIREFKKGMINWTYDIKLSNHENVVLRIYSPVFKGEVKLNS